MYIAQLSFGYSWKDVHYNEQTSQFTYKKYHCGAIDVCEDFYDGEEPVSKENLLAALIYCNKLDVVYRHYHILNGYQLLEKVIDELATKEPVGELKNGKLFGNISCEYYLFPDGQYIIYFHHGFYTVDENQMCTYSYPAVKRIFENADQVIHYRRYRDTWLGHNFADSI